ncbi:Hypothetical predicted protein [Paramuricea clavata]|uniref:Uncharacterized protein n=1 Tax=Paramuricea clavata TaxID=317549 RepID=A0A7D9IZH5_PARCT|nr:Hypothetical predicted protein [Paramuricea clavata]
MLTLEFTILYFNCPDKMKRIERMFKRADYKDVSLALTFTRPTGSRSRLRVRFGRGWTGRGAEIQGVDYLYGGKKGIIVFITISSSLYVIHSCHLEGPEDTIHLGNPTEIKYDWSDCPACYVRWQEEAEEMDEIRREVTEISNEVLDWEEEMLDDMQIEAEMEEALWGQFDWEEENLNDMQMDAEMGEALQGQVDLDCQVVVWRRCGPSS